MVNESAWPEREKERARELERKGEGEGETCNEVIPFPVSFFQGKRVCNTRAHKQHTVNKKQATKER